MDRDDSKGNGSYEKENFFWEIFELWAPKMYCVFIHLKFHQRKLRKLFLHSKIKLFDRRSKKDLFVLKNLSKF